MKRIEGRLRNRGFFLVLATGAVLAAVGGIAYTSIPGPDGVIKGCRHKNSGAHRVIDSSATCSSSEVALNWNQAGPTGPTGPSDADAASNPYMRVGGGDTVLASVEVPAGSYTVAAKSHLYNTTEDSFAVCELRAGDAVIDESINRLISPANDQVVPFLGVVTLTGAETIALVCNGNGVESVESEETTVVATRIGTLHN